jgi:hypothetical protein
MSVKKILAHMSVMQDLDDFDLNKHTSHEYTLMYAYKITAKTLAGTSYILGLTN